MLGDGVFLCCFYKCSAPMFGRRIALEMALQWSLVSGKVMSVLSISISISIRISISISKTGCDNPHHEARVAALGEISSARSFDQRQSPACTFLPIDHYKHKQKHKHKDQDLIMMGIF